MSANKNNVSFTFPKDGISAARGIGILAVVIGHLSVAYPLPSVSYWHIPLFFFIAGAGMVNSRPLKKTIKHVLVDTLLYLFAWTFIYGVLVYFVPPFSSMSLHFPNEPFWLSVTTHIFTLNSHSVGLMAPCWFLLAYAGVTAVSTPLARVLPKYAAVPMGLVLTAGGWLLGGEQPYPLGQSFPLMLIGQVLLGSGFCLFGLAFFRSGRAMAEAVRLRATVASCLIAGTLIMIYRPIPMGMSGMQLDDNITSSLVIGMCSIQVVLWLSFHLRGWAWLTYLGRESKAIMTHHLFGVALVNVLLVALGVLTAESVQAYTVFQPQDSWMVYLAVALAVPLAIAWATSRIKRNPNA